jgi:tetratricopeptide (TPR) repeat protein
MSLYSNDHVRALELAQNAQKTGEQFNDADLESLGLVYAGTARVMLGQTREGLASLDEAGASLVSCDLSPWAGGLVYCGVIFSCLNRSDWKRAGHWTEQFTRWGEDKGAAAYPGLCRMHRAELLGVRGELEEAEQEIRATRELLARDAPWVEGEAWRVLGEILVSRGRLDDAEQAFARATELGWDVQFNLALLRLAEGDPEGATTLLARTLAENTWSGRAMRGRVLAYQCIAASFAGQVKTARSALAWLEKEPELTSTAALQALTAQARGELAAAEKRGDQAITLLRIALHAWIEMEAPLMAAETRCRLAQLLMKEDDPESASLELAAASAAFRRAGAHGMLSKCVELQSRLHP